MVKELDSRAPMQGVIDTDSEHHAVLFELGILDDMEDWTLFKLQEHKFDIDIDYATWFKYVRHDGRELPEQP